MNRRTIIAAHPGFKLAKVYVHQGVYEVETSPIIGWAILSDLSEENLKAESDHHIVQPLTPDMEWYEAANLVGIAVMMPDGVVATRGGDGFDNVDAWLAEIRGTRDSTGRPSRE
jgi:hypothetical protein